ncbi:ABC transporter substrate-binding protein [Clostridium sp. 19966]|uniref:ABC transporter substrate-binding protein n=1 Tax=Clostridium sp. 19966 TaxID=2768166 RepID=UPI0028DE78E5|nr:ABC transporter substrate-binding protein [Clostridium sp. 19966]MDT8717261.1 ABC transporter substrate-binding protein [Clostridium sp. 19966]
MNKKKIVTCLVCAALVVTVFAGCGKKNESNSSSSNGKNTFTLFVDGGGYKPLQLTDTTVGKEITKLTGVTLKCDYLVGSDEKTKAGLMIASGEYPDLLNGGNALTDFISAGALVPLDDYIEKYGTNIKKYYGDDLKKLKSPDGHIYTLSPGRKANTPIYATSGFNLIADLLKQQGYPKVTELNDYFDRIEKYVKENPNYNGKPTIGFAAETDSTGNYILTNAPAYLAGYPNTGNNIITKGSDGQYTAKNFYLTNYAHDYFKKLNEEWSKGILDPDMFTQNQDAFKAKISSGRVVGYYDERWRLSDSITALEQQKQYDRIPVSMPVTFAGVTNNSYGGINVTSVQAGVSITKSCKDPVAAFKFLDAMCGDEIQKLVEWGQKGTDYEVDSNGKMTKNADQLKQMDDANYGQTSGIGQFWMFPHPNFGKDSKYADGNIVSPQDTDAYISTKYKPYEQDIVKAYNVKSLADLVSAPIDSPFGYGWDIQIPDSKQDVKIAQQNAGNIAIAYMPKLITGKTANFESVWSEYSQKMKDAKYDIGNDYITQQVNQRVKDWGTASK